MARVEQISDVHLFVFTVVWVVLGGLLLQLVVLPYVLPDLHWGHGLIAGLDWTSFHNLAIAQRERILRDGWSAWELRPNGQLPAGVASVLYVLVYPEPWVVLPFNGALFAATVVAVRRMLAVMFDSQAVATWALAPFFVYVSFVPIWGQLHKDVTTGAGLALVLNALVLAGYRDRPDISFWRPIRAAAFGIWLVWLARPYGAVLLSTSTLAFVAISLLGKSRSRTRLASVAATVLLSTGLLNVGPWADENRVILQPLQVAAPAPAALSVEAQSATSPTPATAKPRWTWLRLPRLRRIDPKNIGEGYNLQRCAPEPTTQLLDKALYSLCVHREGFRSDGLGAGSNHDYDLRMRSVEDLIAYFPRATSLALLEPLPTRWLTERSDIGRLGSYFIPLEMLVAYGAFGLALVFARTWLVRPDIWAVVAYCVAYTVSFVFTTPNMGTLYRMRAFAFAILVSTALAAFLARVMKPVADVKSALSQHP